MNRCSREMEKSFCAGEWGRERSRALHRMSQEMSEEKVIDT